MLKGTIRFCFFILWMIVWGPASGQTAKELLSPPRYVQYKAAAGAFPIAANGKTAAIYVAPEDWKGVVRAANDLGDDVRKVSGKASEVFPDVGFGKGSILVGTIGKSRIIDKLIADKKIDVAAVKGKWE